MTLTVEVASARALASDIRELVLRPADGSALPVFSPGSHVVVHVPGDRVRKNAYSLACAPWATDAYRIAVRRLDGGRGGSVGVHERIAVGDRLVIEPPRNLFAPILRARRHLLVAGGIGLTPFVSYVHQLRAEGIPFELHVGQREEAAGPLVDELSALAPGAIHRYVDADGSRLLAGVRAALADQPLGTHLSVCGPVGMMEAVLAAARAVGWPDSRLHLERFAADTGPMEPFAVRLARSGRAIAVGGDETLLEALERSGVEVPYLCRQGVCGECRVGVLDGAIDHRDVFLTPEERASGTAVMPCQSRCANAGPLVLDLA